jgi:hypothetical protein
VLPDGPAPTTIASKISGASRRVALSVDERRGSNEESDGLRRKGRAHAVRPYDASGKVGKLRISAVGSARRGRTGKIRDKDRLLRLIDYRLEWADDLRDSSVAAAPAPLRDHVFEALAECEERLADDAEPHAVEAQGADRHRTRAAASAGSPGA